MAMSHAQISSFGPDEDDDCELCWARRAIGTFNFEGVEIPLCGHCSVYRNADNSEVAFVDARTS